MGVPISDYVVRYLADPGGDIAGSQDDQLLPVFDRKPESFGLDRYVLTNPPGLTGRHQGVELRVEKALGSRLALVAEAFNLLGGRNEVEENPVWGASFRDPTAVQPPRVVRVGGRFDF